MQALDIAKSSLHTLWSNKYLWFFGFFVVGGSSGGSVSSHVGTNSNMISSLSPELLVALLVGATLLGIASLVMHVLSEGALIDGVRCGQAKKHLGIRQAMRIGVSHFWRLLAIKIGVSVVGFLSVALITAPWLMGRFEILPLWVGGLLTATLGVAGIPWLLTIYFVYVYALRVAVMENLPAMAAARKAKLFLHGRIASSLRMMVLALVGELCGLAASVVALIPAALLGGLVYLSTSHVLAALIVVDVCGLPLLVAVLGAAGTFRSSIWTLNYLESRLADKC